MSREKKQILVVFGGASPEYEVACDSAASLIDAIDREKFDVHCVGISKDGQWWLTKASTKEIADSISWLEHSENKRAVLSPDRGAKGLIIMEGNSWSLQHIDVIFPMVHGETGEDGELPALFELAGIPYVGSGVCSSACSMDKTVTMMFSDICGIKRPNYFCCTCSDFKKAPEKTTDDVISMFESCQEQVFPLFVKPASTGSSIGISKVFDRAQLFTALREASKFGGHIIVEENISGREMKVAVMGNDEPVTGDICEIFMSDGNINSYELKYKSNGSHKIIPAELPEDKVAEIKKAAVDIYKKLNCKGFSRVDFFLRDDGELYFNEINTIPGFSRKSIFSLMFNSIGISYEEIVDELITLALVAEK